ncbi:response regulator receiver domain-containing protein [Tahibacter aquaticus]|uniref:Response regulator receiver domain-containing protein n=1 Tax=Tahibacter aquaticus TaxID=520092 RepID=A0A4R6Z4X4_9GAMM|nr:response regulator [Tahibacter aquaticus]TDR46747.1 response regulator receiver domain-containing protein [Tahibacter aquaticus]
MNQADVWSGGKAVVVDDNAASAFLLADFLRMIGHRADVLASAQLDVLVDAILAKEPDLVFLDLMLGQLSGHDVARVLRERGCEAYLVAVTGWGEPDDQKFSLDVGFDEHWTKPLDTSRVEVFMREKPRRSSKAAA